jgi:hypothetical protein
MPQRGDGSKGGNDQEGVARTYLDGEAIRVRRRSAAEFRSTPGAAALFRSECEAVDAEAISMPLRASNRWS